ncbi:transposase, partial [Lyngbya sp. CCY1209]|uniref:transposase n=1 Tax=Lyngbya sp. CCY1209 TaxID=2886103 RepID=UPI002D211604
MFLTTSEGFSIDAPLFFKQSLREIQKANRELSRKQKGSNNRERARKNLVRRHEDIVHRREDWFWKLAHWLTDRFDVLYFETLNLKAMQRLWGRKVS